MIFGHGRWMTTMLHPGEGRCSFMFVSSFHKSLCIDVFLGLYRILTLPLFSSFMFDSAMLSKRVAVAGM